MATFILPTSGPATYRGKYPARPRSISHGTTGTHIELNDGTRLWSAARTGVLAALRLSDKPDLSATVDAAERMTESQYATLLEAADLLRGRLAERRANGKALAELEARARAMVESILSPDERAEKAKAELFAAYGTDRAELEAEAKAAAGLADETPGGASAAIDGLADRAAVRLVQTRGPDGESRLVRRDNVEYHAGRKAFADGEAQEDCPYCPGGERGARWNLGWREAAAEADEREAAEADERAAKVSPDAARALGAQSCACNLERSANPFPADSAAGEAWDSGYSEAMADWRAERRADIADRYGDEAADHF